MANTPWASNNSRYWFAGANADIDIHIEAYEGTIDGSFRVESLFRSSNFTNFKSVAHQSNTWRGDRLGGVSVTGRKSGEAPTTQRIANEKLVITVDTTSLVRTTTDDQDDWTAPDITAEYSAEHATAHAKAFDQAHIIQLIKCAAFTPPADLAGSFWPGISKTTTGLNAATASGLLTKAEVQADILVQTHKDALSDLVKRDLGGELNRMVTLVDVDTFSLLLDHRKLMNVDFSADNGNFAGRRVAHLNGTTVVETPRFPKSAIASHFLGPAFNVSAAEAKACMIIFDPARALVTVEAQPMTVRVIPMPQDFATLLDSYTMYTVGQRRPDAVAVIFRE